MMIGVAGDVLLMLILALASVQAIAPWLAKMRGDERYHQLIWPAAKVQAACATLALLLLVIGFATSDFSLLSVVLNSHTDKPMLYKITGSWGNHEGSMLLWLWVLSTSCVLAAWRNPLLRNPMLNAQGWMMVGLAIYVLFASSPFVMVEPAPLQGQGLNPLLQDIGLAMHPPMLYAGYVGFGVVFAYAIAAMRTGRCDMAWATMVHPWITLSWGCLTLGIGLGSWWAYRELGWGGWWFWDPVENVSLLPWLSGTALLHANLTLRKRGQMAQWTLLLAIITFTLSLVGTFIVRSGLLVSVHSFASDPARGILILIYITSIVCFALYHFSCFNQKNEAAPPIRLLSRSGFILINHLLMLSAAATVLLAILYPLLLQLLGLGSITVGAPYYNSTMLPLMAPVLLVAGIAPLLKWESSDLRIILRQLAFPAIAASVIAVTCLAMVDQSALQTAGGLSLAGWLMASTLVTLRKARQGAGHIPFSLWSMAAGHFGFALLAACITIQGLHHQTFETRLKVGETKQVGDVSLSFLKDTLGTHDNYSLRRSAVRIEKSGHPIATLQPELRYYPERATQTTEAAIASGLRGDVYLVSALQDTPDMLAFTLHLNPAMGGLWMGFLMIATGGFIATLRSLIAR